MTDAIETPCNWFFSRREELSLSVFDLSIRLRITPQAIRSWEQGKSYPTPTKAVDLAAAYEADLATIAVQIIRLAIAVADERRAA